MLLLSACDQSKAGGQPNGTASRRATVIVHGPAILFGQFYPERLTRYGNLIIANSSSEELWVFDSVKALLVPDIQAVSHYSYDWTESKIYKDFYCPSASSIGIRLFSMPFPPSDPFNCLATVLPGIVCGRSDSKSAAFIYEYDGFPACSYYKEGQSGTVLLGRSYENIDGLTVYEGWEEYEPFRQYTDQVTDFYPSDPELAEWYYWLFEGYGSKVMLLENSIVLYNYPRDLLCRIKDGNPANWILQEEIASNTGITDRDWELRQMAIADNGSALFAGFEIPGYEDDGIEIWKISFSEKSDKLQFDFIAAVPTHYREVQMEIYQGSILVVDFQGAIFEIRGFE